MGKKLSWGTKFGYGFGTFGKSMSYGLANGFISMYFVSVLGLSTEFLAVMFFLARIWDGVNDLLMGTIIDNTNSGLGKFRPWVLAGAVINAAVTVGLFWQPGLKGLALYVFATAMYLLWDASYTMIDVSYWSMIPALTLDSKERDQVSMLPRIIGGAAGIIGAFTMQIVDKLGGPVINGGYLKYAMISSAVYIVTAALCVMTTKENVSMPSQEKDKFSLGAAARILFSNDQTLVIVGIMILFNLANNLTNAVSPFYFNFVVGNQNMYSMFTILLGAAQAIGLFGFPFFSKWFGRNRVYIGSFLLPCFGYLLMILVNLTLNSSFPFFAAAACVMSIGFGSMGVMQNVMLADAVDYGEWKTGQRNEGIIFSTLTFLSKIAAALSSMTTMVGFSIVHFGGENATTATPEAVRCIEIIMFVLPPVILIAALLIYLKWFKLKPDLVSRISEEIKARRAEQSEQSAS